MKVLCPESILPSQGQAVLKYFGLQGMELQKPTSTRSAVLLSHLVQTQSSVFLKEAEKEPRCL